MAYERCKTCRQWAEMGSSVGVRVGGLPHVCPPEWRVYVWDTHDPADPSDGIDGWGHDAEEVAKEAVEEWENDSAEHAALDAPLLVLVRPLDPEVGSEQWIEVRAEAVVEYSADRANPPAGYKAPGGAP